MIHWSLLILCRIASKVLTFGFTSPGIEPRNEMEMDSFQRLADTVREACSTFLLVIPVILAKCLSRSPKEVLADQKVVSAILPEANHRLIEGYGTILYIIRQVRFM